MQARILAMVLAGGKGDRLGPLTRERSKPAVPFGGKYRIIDFVLSNLINSGIYSIYVLTQFKAQSLLQHLRDGWQFSDMLKNQFVISVPARTCETGSPGCHKGRDWRYHRLRNVRKPGPQWTCDDRPVRIVRRSGAGSDLGTDQGRTRRDRGTHAALEAFEMATQSGRSIGCPRFPLGRRASSDRLPARRFSMRRDNCSCGAQTPPCQPNLRCYRT